MSSDRQLACNAHAFLDPVARYVPRVCLAALSALVLSLLPASSALASSPFEQCPKETATYCFNLTSTGGELRLSKDTIPLTNTIVVQGGVKVNLLTGAEMFLGALNGETLSKTREVLPGGLLGLIGSCSTISNATVKRQCEEAYENKMTGVNVIAELAKPANEIGISKKNFLKEEGVALQLPVKLRLENPFLGSECYIGSSAKPVVWPLTTGTTSPPAPNKPITGTKGKGEKFAEGEKFVGASLLENAWAAPGASGCDGEFASVVDPILDEHIGLPAAAGTNTVILDGTVYYS